LTEQGTAATAHFAKYQQGKMGSTGSKYYGRTEVHRRVYVETVNETGNLAKSVRLRVKDCDELLLKR
jgi:hypothetical protein